MYKPNDVSMPHNRVLRKSEALLICSKTEELHHNGDKFIHDVLIQNHTKKEKFWSHPSVKFIEVIRKCILSHSCKNWLILDPFAGSGTTGVAAKQLGRNYILIEKEQKYIDIIKQRLKQGVL